ncbi:putative membrane protein [Streptomyces sp. V3I8]|uniref:hypothetical protein n=1 Tax=Streptomyces sp. V3I8 TaxID=3042279 RepID=UPI0027872D0F|nr:hypothetical protein [Streptomyces sp. V3I8]MDQ1038021.1 putative membrane protein [Streptomyces sp. V3I8]
MAGSAKPRRRKAAASSLQYEHRPGRRTAREDEDSGTGNKLFGCLALLAIAVLLALFIFMNEYWGDDTWKWVADAWPGGAYGFAVFAGALVPCVVTLFVMTLAGLSKERWKTHKARSLGRTLLAVLCGAVMLQLASLIFVAQDTGKWGRGVSVAPSWTFRTQPWLWAVGLAATVAMAALLIAVAVLRQRGRSETGLTGPTNSAGPASSVSSD